MINSGIKVLCRFRPLNTAEATSSSSRLCISQLSAESVQIVTSDRSLHSYTFDNCWGTNSTQKQVYEGSGKPIVDSVLQGYNGAIIAYGQTGSGKTHTMMGPNGNADVDEEEQGLCPRSVRDIFKYMEQADEGMEFSVVVSFVEIYQEKVRDLLDVSKDDLNLHSMCLLSIKDLLKEDLFNVLESLALHFNFLAALMLKQVSLHCLLKILLCLHCFSLIPSNYIKALFP
jgi:kinesin family protein 5